MGEQPNPWELLHPQDAMNRHRGAKPERRCELLTPTKRTGCSCPLCAFKQSLLSPAYLLSPLIYRSERWPFHSEPPDHQAHRRHVPLCAKKTVLLSYLLDSLVSQSTWFMPLYSKEDFSRPPMTKARAHCACVNVPSPLSPNGNTVHRLQAV
jgi:hypothetical protein